MSAATISILAGSHMLVAILGVALTLWRNRGQAGNVVKETGDVFADIRALDIKSPADLLKLLANPAAPKRLATDLGQAIDAIRDLIAKLTPAPAPAIATPARAALVDQVLAELDARRPNIDRPDAAGPAA